MKESWSAPGDPDVLRAEFEGWEPRIGTLLSKVQNTFRWALYDREPLPIWTKGRLTLLGDAAHPMLPHLGQGANQSIEDGMALATILAQASIAQRSRLRCMPMSACGASALPPSSAARARTACVWIHTMPISAFAMPRSGRMRSFARNSTATMSSRRRRRSLCP